MQSGSGTTGRGANLIFLDWVGLQSSSEGRMEAWKAGELGRDLEELRGDTLRRIDCKVGFAIILLTKARRRRRRRRRRWTSTLGA